MEQAHPKVQIFEIVPIGHSTSLLLHLDEVYDALEVEDEMKQLKLLFPCVEFHFFVMSSL